MRNSTAIERIENSIAAGTYPEPVLAHRVYVITTSVEHLKAGSDFRLHYSDNTLEGAKEVAAEINAEGFELAVTI